MRITDFTNNILSFNFEIYVVKIEAYSEKCYLDMINTCEKLYFVFWTDILQNTVEEISFCLK